MKFNKSMVEYVKSYETRIKKYELQHYYAECLDIANSYLKYANFLSQKLEIWMFVACDENGNVLIKPKPIDFKVDVNEKCSNWKYIYDENDKVIGYYDSKSYEIANKEYQAALSKVIFEGFEVFDNCVEIPNTIEDLFYYVDNNWHLSKEFNTTEDLIPYNLDIKESVAQELGLI